jgi:hypothetical protein
MHKIYAEWTKCCMSHLEPEMILPCSDPARARSSRYSFSNDRADTLWDSLIGTDIRTQVVKKRSSRPLSVMQKNQQGSLSLLWGIRQNALRTDPLILFNSFFLLNNSLFYISYFPLSIQKMVFVTSVVQIPEQCPHSWSSGEIQAVSPAGFWERLEGSLSPHSPGSSCCTGGRVLLPHRRQGLLWEMNTVIINLWKNWETKCNGSTDLSWIHLLPLWLWRVLQTDTAAPILEVQTSMLWASCSRRRSHWAILLRW